MEKLDIQREPGDNVQQSQASVYAQTTLEAFPDELLIQTFRLIADPHDIVERKAQADINTLCDLARTCRRFKPIAQEVLVNTIVLEAGEMGYVDNRLARLIKFLLEYPLYRGRVRNLRIEVTKTRDFLHWVDTAGFVPEHWRFKSACAEVASQAEFGDTYINELWAAALGDGFEPAFAGILLCLAPNLENLMLLPSSSEHTASPTIMDMFGLDYGTVDRHYPSGDKGVLFKPPALAKLRRATFRSDYLPKALSSLPKLTSVNLILGSGHGFELSTEYIHITSLRMSACFEWIRAPHADGWDDDTFRHIKRLLPTLPKLKAFELYDETDKTKNIDELPPDSPCDCDRPFHFDYLLDMLYEACDNIETISLPANWYRKNQSSHALTRDMPCFPKLTNLSLPECALKGTDGTFERPDWGPLAVPEAVGTTLESLRIVDPSDGDGELNIENLFKWLIKLFKGNEEDSALTALTDVCIVVGVTVETVVNALSYKSVVALTSAMIDSDVKCTVVCADKTIPLYMTF
jgi:hypothetical protein